MEYYINDEVITLDLNITEGTLINNNRVFNIDFNSVLRPFINKYKLCNIELVQAAQHNFGDSEPVNFVIYGLPWVNQTNISTLGTGRILGGYDRPALLLPNSTSLRNLIDVNDFVGQIETFSLQNLGGRTVFIISLLNGATGNQVPPNNLGGCRFVFKFYPVYENYIDVIYNDDNERRKIKIR